MSVEAGPAAIHDTGPTYNKSDPAVSRGIAKHIVDRISRPTRVRSREEKKKVCDKAKSRAKRLRIPVKCLYFLRQPEIKVSWV